MTPRPQVIWMQLGVRNDEAAAKAEAAGLKVVMNRCPKIEYGRLSSEIGWIGVNSRTLARSAPRSWARASSACRSTGPPWRAGTAPPTAPRARCEAGAKHRSWNEIRKASVAVEPMLTSGRLSHKLRRGGLGGAHENPDRARFCVFRFDAGRRVGRKPNEQNACMNDAFNVCGQAIPDRDRVAACLAKNIRRISPACRTVMTRHHAESARRAKKRSARR